MLKDLPTKVPVLVPAASPAVVCGTARIDPVFSNPVFPYVLSAHLPSRCGVPDDVGMIYAAGKWPHGVQCLSHGIWLSTCEGFYLLGQTVLL